MSLISSPPSIFYASSLHPCGVACMTPLLMRSRWLSWWCACTDTWRSTLSWPSIMSTVCVIPKHLLDLNGLKIAPVAVEKQCYHVAALRGDVELLWVISAHLWEREESDPLTRFYWLYFFFFKTENGRFTTGLKQTLTLNLLTPTKRYQKCTIVLIHLLKVWHFPMIILSSCNIYTNTILYTVEIHNPVFPMCGTLTLQPSSFQWSKTWCTLSTSLCIIAVCGGWRHQANIT